MTISIIADTQYPNRVLYLGNSYTYYNNGVNSILDSLIAEAKPNLEFRSQIYAKPAYTLRDHFREDSLFQILNSEKWNLVILQEHSTRPVKNPSKMYRYARLIHKGIRQTQAKTGLFMTWGHKNKPTMINELAPAYETIGQELNAEIFPVGIAFKNVSELYPTINLYAEDKSHPSYEGSYLAACVFFCMLFNESPEGLAYVPSESSISSNTARILQKIAWKTIKEYRKNESP